MSPEFRAGERSDDRDHTTCQDCGGPAEAYASGVDGWICKACCDADDAADAAVQS
jgi:hypothetical protein